MKSLSKKQKRFNDLGRFFLFLMLLGGLLILFSGVLYPKHDSDRFDRPYQNARGFYAERANSIDLLMIGNSDAYSAFSPMELWERSGYSSYVCAEPSQTVEQAVKLLKEALSCQKPKLIIMEVDNVFSPKNNLLQTFGAFFEKAVPILKHHNFWKRMEFSDLVGKPAYLCERNVLKGQNINARVKGFTGKEYMVKTDRKEEISKKAQTYLDEFVDICKEAQIPLLFVEMPSGQSWDFAKHNAIQQYASEKGCQFFDFNLIENREKMQFDWKTDTCDGGFHLNTQGAIKVTRLLSEYLHDNHYVLPDHRNDPSYQSWQDDYKQYSNLVAHDSVSPA